MIDTYYYERLLLSPNILILFGDFILTFFISDLFSKCLVIGAETMHCLIRIGIIQILDFDDSDEEGLLEVDNED